MVVVDELAARAVTRRSVVVNRAWAAVLSARGVSFGKLCRLSGNVSTTISQSVMSTDSTISLRVNAVHHGSATVILFASETAGPAASALR